MAALSLSHLGRRSYPQPLKSREDGRFGQQ